MVPVVNPTLAPGGGGTSGIGKVDESPNSLCYTLFTAIRSHSKEDRP